MEVVQKWDFFQYCWGDRVKILEGVLSKYTSSESESKRLKKFNHRKLEKDFGESAIFFVSRVIRTLLHVMDEEKLSSLDILLRTLELFLTSYRKQHYFDILLKEDESEDGLLASLLHILEFHPLKHQPEIELTLTLLRRMAELSASIGELLCRFGFIEAAANIMKITSLRSIHLLAVELIVELGHCGVKDEEKSYAGAFSNTIVELLTSPRVDTKRAAMLICYKSWQRIPLNDNSVANEDDNNTRVNRSNKSCFLGKLSNSMNRGKMLAKQLCHYEEDEDELEEESSLLEEDDVGVPPVEETIDAAAITRYSMKNEEDVWFDEMLPQLNRFLISRHNTLQKEAADIVAFMIIHNKASHSLIQTLGTLILLCTNEKGRVLSQSETWEISHIEASRGRSAQSAFLVPSLSDSRFRSESQSPDSPKSSKKDDRTGVVWRGDGSMGARDYEVVLDRKEDPVLISCHICNNIFNVVQLVYPDANLVAEKPGFSPWVEGIFKRLRTGNVHYCLLGYLIANVHEMLVDEKEEFEEDYSSDEEGESDCSEDEENSKKMGGGDNSAVGSVVQAEDAILDREKKSYIISLVISTLQKWLELDAQLHNDIRSVLDRFNIPVTNRVPLESEDYSDHFTVPNIAASYEQLLCKRREYFDCKLSPGYSGNRLIMHLQNILKVDSRLKAVVYQLNLSKRQDTADLIIKGGALAERRGVNKLQINMDNVRPKSMPATFSPHRPRSTTPRGRSRSGSPAHSDTESQGGGDEDDLRALESAFPSFFITALRKVDKQEKPFLFSKDSGGDHSDSGGRRSRPKSQPNNGVGVEGKLSTPRNRPHSTSEMEKSRRGAPSTPKTPTSYRVLMDKMISESKANTLKHEQRMAVLFPLGNYRRPHVKVSRLRKAVTAVMQTIDDIDPHNRPHSGVSYANDKKGGKKKKKVEEGPKSSNNAAMFEDNTPRERVKTFVPLNSPAIMVANRRAHTAATPSKKQLEQQKEDRARNSDFRMADGRPMFFDKKQWDNWHNKDSEVDQVVGGFEDEVPSGNALKNRRPAIRVEREEERAKDLAKQCGTTPVVAPPMSSLSPNPPSSPRAPTSNRRMSTLGKQRRTSTFGSSPRTSNAPATSGDLGLTRGSSSPMQSGRRMSRLGSGSSPSRKQSFFGGKNIQFSASSPRNSVSPRRGSVMTPRRQSVLKAGTPRTQINNLIGVGNSDSEYDDNDDWVDPYKKLSVKDALELRRDATAVQRYNKSNTTTYNTKAMKERNAADELFVNRDEYVYTTKAAKEVMHTVTINGNRKNIAMVVAEPDAPPEVVAPTISVIDKRASRPKLKDVDIHAYQPPHTGTDNAAKKLDYLLDVADFYIDVFQPGDIERVVQTAQEQTEIEEKEEDEHADKEKEKDGGVNGSVASSNAPNVSWRTSVSYQSGNSVQRPSSATAAVQGTPFPLRSSFKSPARQSSTTKVNRMPTTMYQFSNPSTPSKTPNSGAKRPVSGRIMTPMKSSPSKPLSSMMPSDDTNDLLLQLAEFGAVSVTS